MTPEQEQAIRARHVRSMSNVCHKCFAPWPCDAATLLAALDEARAATVRLVEFVSDCDQSILDAFAFNENNRRASP